MNFLGWMRLLIRNRFSVSPSRIPMALIITGISVFNSGLSVLQRVIYGRRIARTELVDDPVFVLGHWRSGTTLVHELLAMDPRHAAPSTFACFCPNHFLLTGRILPRCLRLLLPSQRPMDNMALSWESPQEDEWAMCNGGLPSPYLSLAFPNRPPQWSEYLDLRDVPAAALERWKRGLRRFLQCVTLQNPKRLVLKSPQHTCRLRVLVEMFPRARFVHIVRNPFVIFPSTIKTWKRFHKYHGLQVPRYEGLEEYVFTTFQRMYEAFEEDRDLVEPGRLCDVRYEDLVQDPVGQMRRIYEQLGLEGFEQARPGIEQYLARTADYQPNRYELPPELRAEISRRWKPYFERYAYAPEPEVAEAGTPTA